MLTNSGKDLGWLYWVAGSETKFCQLWHHSGKWLSKSTRLVYFSYAQNVSTPHPNTTTEKKSEMIHQSSGICPAASTKLGLDRGPDHGPDHRSDHEPDHGPDHGKIFKIQVL